MPAGLGGAGVMPGSVVIDVETCKGCGLCVPVCPPKVLDMSIEVNGKGYRYPLLRPGCTGCELCAKICPDYCIDVFRAAGEARRISISES